MGDALEHTNYHFAECFSLFFFIQQKALLYPRMHVFNNHVLPDRAESILITGPTMSYVMFLYR